ncbi:MAG: mechanosensitive ion channel family protein [Deltaproteobacteria bacterium]|nr:MAG: mechanosensitive ion channel family protein [Deltaproteobacteria bacterium]
MRTLIIKCWLVGVLLLCGATWSVQADTTPSAESQNVAVESSSSNPLSEKKARQLIDQKRKLIDIESDYFALSEQEKDSKGRLQRLLRSRMDENRINMTNDLLVYANAVAEHRDDGFDVQKFETHARSLLEALPQTVRDGEKRMAIVVSQIIKEETTAVEQAALDQRLDRRSKQTDEMIAAFLKGLDVWERYELNVEEEINQLKTVLMKMAQVRSIFAELAAEELTLRANMLKLLPDDTELLAKNNVGMARVALATKALQRTVDMMSDIGMNTGRYEVQLEVLSGDFTSEVMNLRGASNLVSSWYSNATRWFHHHGLSFFLQGLLFVLILFVSWIVSRIVKTMITRGLQSGRVHLSKLLTRTIIAVSKNLVLFLGLMLAFSQLGISVGPMLAGLGVVGFIIGFALQDTLSNFASGMMILFYRPFDVGDLVDAGGAHGKVHAMSLVNTTILTFDNQMLIIPNNKIWGDVIKNVTIQNERRVDMVFGISYTDDVAKAEQTLHEIVASTEHVLETPEPNIRLHELADSSVNFIVRPWCKTEYYWDVYWDITRKVKVVFDENNISIPFPQQDVHIYQTQGNGAAPVEDADK